MCFDAKEALEEYESFVRELLKQEPEISRLINLCNSDLFNGPLYLDKEGEIVDCFDEHVGQFDFQGACKKIRDWFDANVNDCKVTQYIPNEDYEKEGDDEEIEITERIEDSAANTIKTIVGSELYHYIY